MYCIIILSVTCSFLNCLQSLESCPTFHSKANLWSITAMFLKINVFHSLVKAPIFKICLLRLRNYLMLLRHDNNTIAYWTFFPSLLLFLTCSPDLLSQSNVTTIIANVVPQIKMVGRFQRKFQIAINTIQYITVLYVTYILHTSNILCDIFGIYQ